MSTIKTGTTLTTAYQVEGDTTGTLVIQTGSTSTTAVTIDDSQNVGIGTSSPTRLLTLSGSGVNTRVQINNTVSGKNFGLYAQDDGNSTINYGSSAALLFTESGTERARIDSSGNFKFNSGYGSVATAYGCRAWVNFNGTGTVAIRASGNVSSITDNGTGDYTVNFTTAMPDANYAYTFGLRTWQDGWSGYAPVAIQWLSDTASTTQMRFRTMDSNQPSTGRDFSTINVSFHR